MVQVNFVQVNFGVDRALARPAIENYDLGDRVKDVGSWWENEEDLSEMKMSVSRMQFLYSWLAA